MVRLYPKLWLLLPVSELNTLLVNFLNLFFSNKNKRLAGMKEYKGCQFWIDGADFLDEDAHLKVIFMFNPMICFFWEPHALFCCLSFHLFFCYTSFIPQIYKLFHDCWCHSTLEVIVTYRIRNWKTLINFCVCINLAN